MATILGVLQSYFVCFVHMEEWSCHVICNMQFKIKCKWGRSETEATPKQFLVDHVHVHVHACYIQEGSLTEYPEDSVTTCVLRLYTKHEAHTDRIWAVCCIISIIHGFMLVGLDSPRVHRLIQRCTKMYIYTCT